MTDRHLLAIHQITLLPKQCPSDSVQHRRNYLHFGTGSIKLPFQGHSPAQLEFLEELRPLLVVEAHLRILLGRGTSGGVGEVGLETAFMSAFESSLSDIDRTAAAMLASVSGDRFTPFSV